MDRLCFDIVLLGGRWQVQTLAPWPDALAQQFDSRDEALAVASIAARVEWEHSQRPTCVCLRDAAGLRRQECAFGESPATPPRR